MVFPFVTKLYSLICETIKGKTKPFSLGSFIIFVFFVTIPCNIDIMPKTGTLPASQWVITPLGLAIIFLFNELQKTKSSK